MPTIVMAIIRANRIGTNRTNQFPADTNFTKDSFFNR